MAFAYHTWVFCGISALCDAFQHLAVFFFFFILSRASLSIKIIKQDLPLSVALNLISLQLFYGHDVILEGKFN